MFYDTNVVSNFEDPTGFVTYIDESGDEGFVFNPDGSGSSRWFVYCRRLLLRRINDLQMVECLREARKVLGKGAEDAVAFRRFEARGSEFRTSDGWEIWISELSTLPFTNLRSGNGQRFKAIRICFIAIPTRFLVERLSWLLSRSSTGTPGQNRFTEVIFSDRANMSYEDIRDYLRRLVRQSDAGSEQGAA